MKNAYSRSSILATGTGRRLIKTRHAALIRIVLMELVIVTQQEKIHQSSFIR